MRKDLLTAGAMCLLLGICAPMLGAEQYWNYLLYVGAGIIIWSVLPGAKPTNLELLFKACKLYTVIDGKEMLPKVIKTENGENSIIT